MSYDYTTYETFWYYLGYTKEEIPPDEKNLRFRHLVNKTIKNTENFKLKKVKQEEWSPSTVFKPDIQVGEVKNMTELDTVIEETKGPVDPADLNFENAITQKNRNQKRYDKRKAYRVKKSLKRKYRGYGY